MASSINKTYRFRAECEQDIYEFQELLEWGCIGANMQFVDVDSGPFPDRDVELVTDAALDDLIEIALLGSDLHIIAETLALAEEFTGIRNFGGRGGWMAKAA